MSQVAIVTDSTQYLPEDVRAAHDLHVVSLYVTRAGTQERESDITDYGRFYGELRAASDLPSTSQPSIGDFLAVFEPLLADGRDIVCVLISGGISGTVESARQAAAEALASHPGRRIEVVDSGSSCGGLGLIAMAAATAARGGADVDTVVARAFAAKETMKIWFAVDTLEFLRRGGRIGAAQAYLGSALKIKPILTLGKEIEPIERVRTAGRAVERMKEHLAERFEAGCDAFAVQHIQDPGRAAELVEAGRAIYGAEPVFVSEIGPVIGTHIGPGLLGVSGFRTALLQAR
jgi:DegV family protein with EDD domain